MGDYAFDSTESETLEANEMQMWKDVSDLNGRDIPLRLSGPTNSEGCRVWHIHKYRYTPINCYNT